MDIHPTVWNQKEKNDYQEIARKEKELILSEMKRFRDSGYELEHLINKADFTGDMRLFGNIISEIYSSYGFDERIFILLIKLKPEKRLYYYYVEETYNRNKKDPDIIFDVLRVARAHDTSSQIIITLAQIDYQVFNGHDIHEYLSVQEIVTFWQTLPYQTVYSIAEKDVKYLLEKSLEFCNSELFWTSLEQINRELSPLECLSYLELAVSQEVKSEESNIYYVEKVFEKLYEQLDLLQYKERIAPLEFKFLQLKAFENGSCFHSIIKEDPGLYASCIDMLYKHEDGKEPDKKEINMSTVFDIFHTLNFCPGETNGSIDEPVLRNWVSEFQRLLEKQHQSLLFHSFLGRLLAHSPAGDDCYEPHEAVRRLIEEIYQADIKESFYIERLNMRGIYNVTDGRDDKILADKYRANAKALFQNYPKVASIYSLLAENYEKKAKEARKQAEQVDGY